MPVCVSRASATGNKKSEITRRGGPTLGTAEGTIDPVQSAFGGVSLMSVAEAAKRVYEEDLRSQLEREHKDDFVAIEPSSRSYFLGTTFLEVALAAKEAYPDRKSFVIRVGHEAAFHIGGFSS